MVSDLAKLAAFGKAQQNQSHLRHPSARMAQIGSAEAGRQGKSDTIRRAQVAGRVGFLAIRSRLADGGKGLFFKEFNASTAIHHRGRSELLACVASV
jgi:hypothetical protein